MYILAKEIVKKPLRSFSVFESVVVKHFTRSYGINQLWSNKYYERVSVALIIQHAKCMRLIKFSSIACLAVRDFPTLSHKRHDFRENVTIYKMCLLFFSTSLFENFLILRIQRDNVISTRYSWQDINENWIFSTGFRKILKYQISLKCVQWEPSCLTRARNGPTDRTKLTLRTRLKMDLREIGWELRNGIIWLRMTSGLLLCTW